MWVISWLCWRCQTGHLPPATQIGRAGGWLSIIKYTRRGLGDWSGSLLAAVSGPRHSLYDLLLLLLLGGHLAGKVLGALCGCQCCLLGLLLVSLAVSEGFWEGPHFAAWLRCI